MQHSCWKSIIKAACTSIWVHFLIFFCYFFAVFKMIGREHQARLELPSFGFSKVRNPYAITDHPKMMLCYKAMCPSPLACTVCTGPLYIVLPKQILFKNMGILHLYVKAIEWKNWCTKEKSIDFENDKIFWLFGKWWMVGVTDHAWHTALLPLAVPLHKCKRQNVHKLMFTQRCARKCKMLRGKMAQLGIFTNNLFKTVQLKRLKRVLVS